MSFITRAFSGLQAITDADLNAFRTNLDSYLKQHTHATGTAGDGASFVQAGIPGDYFQLFPARVMAINQLFVSSGSGVTTVTDSSAEFGFYENYSLGGNHDLWWRIAPRGGTYEFSLLYRKASSYGIASITIGSVSVGTTIDMYAASASLNNATTISGIVLPDIAPNTMVDLKLTISSKNPSSSAQGFGLQFAALRRTGS